MIWVWQVYYFRAFRYFTRLTKKRPSVKKCKCLPIPYCRHLWNWMSPRVRTRWHVWVRILHDAPQWVMWINCSDMLMIIRRCFLPRGLQGGYKDGLQPESLADGNWLVKQKQPVSKIITKSDTNLRSLYESWFRNDAASFHKKLTSACSTTRLDTLTTHNTTRLIYSQLTIQRGLIHSQYALHQYLPPCTQP